MNAKELATLMGDFAPNANLFPKTHDGNLADALWSVCRKHGEHALAEKLTEVTNRMRAAQWEVLGEQRKWVVTTVLTPTNFNRPESRVVEAATAKDAREVVRHALRDLATFDSGRPNEKYDYKVEPHFEPPVGRILGGTP